MSFVVDLLRPIGSIALAILLAAGSGTDLHPQSEAGEDQGGYVSDIPQGANLVIFRDTAHAAGSAAEVRIDGVTIAELGNKEWTAVKIEDPKVEVVVRLDLLVGFSRRSRVVEIEPGRVQFLRLIPTRDRSQDLDDQLEVKTRLRIRASSAPHMREEVLDCCTFVQPEVNREATL